MLLSSWQDTFKMSDYMCGLGDHVITWTPKPTTQVPRSHLVLEPLCPRFPALHPPRPAGPFSSTCGRAHVLLWAAPLPLPLPCHPLPPPPESP